MELKRIEKEEKKKKERKKERKKFLLVAASWTLRQIYLTNILGTACCSHNELTKSLKVLTKTSEGRYVNIPIGHSLAKEPFRLNVDFQRKRKCSLHPVGTIHL